MDRLLTDETIKVALELEADAKALCIAQDTKTLKAVGEWLEGEDPHDDAGFTERFTRADCVPCMEELIDQLKQGKMPYD